MMWEALSSGGRRATAAKSSGSPGGPQDGLGAQGEGILDHRVFCVQPLKLQPSSFEIPDQALDDITRAGRFDT
jgi:hypothetical protein